MLFAVSLAAAQRTAAGAGATTQAAEPPTAGHTAPAQPPAAAAAPLSAPQPDPAPQTPQSPGGVYTLRSTVPLVILDVVVTDSKGIPVRNLTQADFAVKEAGEPQTIQNFEEAGSRIPDASVTVNSTAELDRLAPRAPVQIVVLDEFNTRFEDMAFARYSLKKFLQKQPDKLSTPTILIAVDLQHFTVLHDYTQDKKALIQSLDNHFAAYPWQVHQYGWVQERYATAFITLRRVAQAVMGHPGHKNMIWIGRGFPPFNFANAPGRRRAPREHRGAGVRERAARRPNHALYDRSRRRNGRSRASMASAAAFNDPFGGEYQFSKLAKATGGTALYGRNDVDAEIGTAIQDGSSFYTLTYRPTNSSRDPQKFRKIEVTLDRPGLKVLTREGYYLQYGPGRVDPTKPSLRLVSDLLAADTSRMTYDGVPMTVTPSADDPDQFLVHLDPQGLFWTPATDTEARHTDFILMVSTFDKKGVELIRDARTFKIGATADVAPTGRLERAVDVKYHLVHNPKAVRARFTVRVTASGRIGAVDATLGAPTAK